MSPRRSVLAAGVVLLGLVVGGLLLGAHARRDALERTQRADRLLEQARSEASRARLAEAERLIQRAIRAAPASPRPYLLRASLLELSAHWREALAESRKALRLAPEDPDVIHAVLTRMPLSDPPGEVEPLARRLIAKAPKGADAHYRLGLALASYEDPRRLPEAIRALAEATRLEPQSAVALTALGRLYLRAADNARALEVLERTVGVLESRPVYGRVEIGALESWIEERRAAAFWLAQAYRGLGLTGDYRVTAGAAAQLSEHAREIRTLRSRAGAVPPDPRALARLQKISRYGMTFWPP